MSAKIFFQIVTRNKGQLISKGHFVFFNSPKKRTKNFCSIRLGQKFEFSSSFLGELETPKRHFEIISETGKGNSFLYNEVLIQQLS